MSIMMRIEEMGGILKNQQENVRRFKILSEYVDRKLKEKTEEKDTWNLADKLFDRTQSASIRPDSKHWCFSYKDIKTFIQKVKQDFDGLIVNADEGGYRDAMNHIEEIIDKRAGNLA